MLTIFNRRELFSTFSISKQSEIRRALSQNKIEYEIKTINRLSPSPVSTGIRASTGSLGTDLSTAYEYIVYVRRKDFEVARSLLGLYNPNL